VFLQWTWLTTTYFFKENSLKHLDSFHVRIPCVVHLVALVTHNIDELADERNSTIISGRIGLVTGRRRVSVIRTIRCHGKKANKGRVAGVGCTCCVAQFRSISLKKEITIRLSMSAHIFSSHCKRFNAHRVHADCYCVPEGNCVDLEFSGTFV